MAPQAGSDPEIFLTGFVLKNSSTGQDVLIDLTAGQSPGAPLAPNLPLMFQHEAKLHIRHNVEGKLHDYHVLMGADPDGDAYTAGQVKTSAAAMCPQVGWIIMIGQLPVAQTDLVSTTPDGTAMAVRLRQQTGQHYVYNLEPGGSRSVVRVDAKGQTVLLQPGMYVAVSPQPGETLKAAPIPSGDAFVAHIRARAAVAGFELPG
jgi:hypothetical protein